MKKFTKKCLLIFVILNGVVALSVLVIFQKPAFSSFYLNTPPTLKPYVKPTALVKLSFYPNSSSNQYRNNTKYVLYWLSMWDSETFSFGAEGYELFERCRYKNCFATHDKKFMPVENYDAIIFHAAQYSEKEHGKPRARKNHQRYIFANMESPLRAYPSNLQKYRSFYNWTMTYRYDSDIVMPYGYVIRRATSYTPPNIQSIKNRTRLVAWFVSNCYTINRRHDLYRNLRRYLSIDVYGACGTLTCPKKYHESSAKCYDLIEKKYKFYLAFENSHCKDYVTEKLYRVLERNIVPVVYGSNDYEKIAPPNSVIVADNYTSAKKLADYLLFLDKNPIEYLKYFEWKKLYDIERTANRTVCKLCRMLNNLSEPQKHYKDIFLWWVGNNHSSCKLGDGLPNISVPIPV